MAISAGTIHSLAVRADGTVWAWGDNDDGILGIGTDGGESDTPVQVHGLDGVVSVAAGGFHSLARKADGTVWSWGANWSGQLGLGHTQSPQPLAAPVPALSGVTAMTAGDEHNPVILPAP